MIVLAIKQRVDDQARDIHVCHK